MAASSLIFDTLLALDIGETQTRALLFDIVDGSYRFVAAGAAPSTIGLPLSNASEGARLAIDELVRLTGRILIGPDENLIVPSTGDSRGVDAMVIVMSGGPPVKTIVTGLLEDISVESGKRLAATTYSQIVDTFSLNDRRKTEARLDAILKIRPDLVLVTGGTEGGAGQSIARMLEPVRLACNLLPAEVRPKLLYAGNQDLGDRIEAVFTGITQVEIAPNVRPSLEDEALEGAHQHLARVYRNIQVQKIAGLQELDTWAGGGLTPRATAFARVIRFLSLDDDAKGVLGVDVGAGSTVIAAAQAGSTHLGVYPELGMANLGELAKHPAHVARISEWLPFPVPDSFVQDYIFNKQIYPASIPVTPEELAVEQALARYALRQAARRITAELHYTNHYFENKRLLPPMEPIIAAGKAITDAPGFGQSMLMVLDALQPVGITTVILDRNNISAALGAAATINPSLAVQVLDSGTFTNLGTVISPASSARPGTPILRVQMTLQDSTDEIKLDVKQGSLEVLPLAAGQAASLYLKPFQRADIGMGPGKGGSLKRVIGGALGVIIDARGRPLQLSSEPERRQELLRKWAWTLGG
jgi:hypothetical protein